MHFNLATLKSADAPSVFVMDAKSINLTRAISGKYHAKVFIHLITDLEAFIKLSKVISSITEYPTCFLLPLSSVSRRRDGGSTILPMHCEALSDYLVEKAVLEAFVSQSTPRLNGSFQTEIPKEFLKTIAIALSLSESELEEKLFHYCLDGDRPNQIFPRQLLETILCGIDDSGALCL